jgi:hypothetical protein
MRNFHHLAHRRRPGSLYDYDWDWALASLFALVLFILVLLSGITLWPFHPQTAALIDDDATTGQSYR